MSTFKDYFDVNASKKKLDEGNISFEDLTKEQIDSKEVEDFLMKDPRYKRIILKLDKLSDEMSDASTSEMFNLRDKQYVLGKEAQELEKTIILKFYNDKK